MRYFPLIWSGLWRKKTRTILTLLAIIVAFLLFGLLQGITAAFGKGVAASNVDRLYVQSRVSFTEPLPVSYKARIEQVPGVGMVTYAHWFGGYYQDAKQQVFSYPIDPGTYFAMYPEIKITPEEVQALINTRTGVIIGAALAEKYHFKVGDHIPIKSAIWTKADGTSDWEFDVVGIFHWPDNAGQENALLLNHSYFDEARAFGKGTVGWYIVHVTDTAKGTEIAGAIDALFRNSPSETRTQNEKESTQSFLKQFGNIEFIVTSIVGAVFFALLFLTGSTMMQSIRERIPDFAILKTMGFTDGAVTAMVLGEALTLCLFAAALGLLAANALFPMAKSVIGIDYLPRQVLVEGALCAVLLALAIGLPPALKVGRMAIVDSLAGR